MIALSAIAMVGTAGILGTGTGTAAQEATPAAANHPFVGT
ncbi:MAG: hypothetical protein AVDCRST_MAG59-2117 [uncultured Thermomicrobiales bacterium]|uniref:Uncharacterized protein n=1 Tax=uncultured Thermomicrobiales bacterium TaxID=1645740 RepID=A0A6J4USZ5_9BACT|nr:MAG: hypothetical protein AVDCRST_MAG59-2117 [uncultured Thermomicrobiales bacterium]